MQKFEKEKVGPGLTSAKVDDTKDVVSFGPFRLDPVRRLLLEGDKPVHLRGRSLDILILLHERPGELVTKSEIMARVWPDTCVESANLTVNICALRRALGDGHAGNRYVINIHSRGYRFVTPVTVSGIRRRRQHSRFGRHPPHSLPTGVTRLPPSCGPLRPSLSLGVR
jgi:DNA-binding winged helix-turn-helix (wHTH) protein